MSTAGGVMLGLTTYDYLLKPYWILTQYREVGKHHNSGMFPGALLMDWYRKEEMKEHQVTDLRIYS